MGFCRPFINGIALGYYNLNHSDFNIQVSAGALFSTGQTFKEWCW
jgi:hypothetical protein